MDFRKHSGREGTHAFLGASKYHWVHYTEEKLVESYRNFLAAQRGTELHAFAAKCITLGRMQPRNRDTVNMYVNDAIRHHMTPEQVLYYSDNCFGTADAISFDERKRVLRIYDLKTGVTPTHMEQLMVYAALFCLEYDISPFEIDIELRIYQNSEVNALHPDPNDIDAIVATIVRFDPIIDELKESFDW